jgi:hypothetical protein
MKTRELFSPFAIPDDGPLREKAPALFVGDPERIRTSDLFLRREAL